MLAQIAASAIGGIFGLMGGERTNAANAEQVRRMNEFNAREAQKTRDFQERMSNTQYQRALEDMRAAGLNPALAYQHGGAGTPTGATASGGAAQMQNSLQAGITGAMQAAETAANLKFTAAQIDKTQADADKARTEANYTRNMFQYDAALKITENLVKKQGWRLTEETFPQLVEKVRKELELTAASASELNARAQEARTRTETERLRQPRLRNEADAESSFWKKTMAPYLNDAHTISQIGTDVMQVIPMLSKLNFQRTVRKTIESNRR